MCITDTIWPNMSRHGTMDARDAGLWQNIEISKYKRHQGHADFSVNAMCTSGLEDDAEIGASRKEQPSLVLLRRNAKQRQATGGSNQLTYLCNTPPPPSPLNPHPQAVATMPEDVLT